MSTTNIHYITEILGKNVKPTTEKILLKILTENTKNNNLVTNVGDINYTDGEQLLQDFNEITDPFCDNIMLAKILDFSYCEGEQKNGKFLVDKEACGGYNKLLRSKFREFTLAGHGVKAKKPYLLYSKISTASGVKQVIGNWKKYKDEYENPVFIPFKVELADYYVSMSLIVMRQGLKIHVLEKTLFYLLTELPFCQQDQGIFKSEIYINFVKDLLLISNIWLHSYSPRAIVARTTNKLVNEVTAEDYASYLREYYYSTVAF
ncbi:hypothetical protein ACI65C_000189 [Semiaphis heraclei]